MTIVSTRARGAATNITDMFDLWTMVRLAHLLGVVLWLGGMLMMGLVVVPVARMAGDLKLIATAARRFGYIGGIAWVLLLVSGFGLMDHRHVAFSDLPDSDYGQKILVKLVLLLAMGVIVLVHAFWQGKKVTRADERGDTVSAHRWRLLGAAFDTLLLVGTLTALWIAASLIP